MNRSIFCSPVLLINGKEILSISSATFNDSGNNILQKLSVSFSEPDLEDSNLFNEKVEFFLNYGSQDGVPLFRGYIKEFKPTERNISITAIDPRTFISGQDSLPVVIDEVNNYDGYTVIQFISEVLESHLNVNKTILTSEALQEMDKPVYMNGIRSTEPPYDTLKKLVETQRDDDDILNVYEYFLGIYHGGLNTSLILRKTKALDGRPDFTFTYNNGIIKLSYKERAPPSFGLAASEDGTTVRFDYGNSPKGHRGVRVSGKFTSREHARKHALAEVMLKQGDDKEITLIVSKGYYLEPGAIIRLEVPDTNIRGQYRITSKKISYSSGKVSCTMKLNKKPIKISDYIN